MSHSAPDKRTRLVQAAMNLVYQLGFGKTTLAHIAQAAKVPLGNVYYYLNSAIPGLPSRQANNFFQPGA